MSNEKYTVRKETKCNKLVIFTVPSHRQINKFSHYLKLTKQSNDELTPSSVLHLASRKERLTHQNAPKRKTRVSLLSPFARVALISHVHTHRHAALTYSTYVVMHPRGLAN